MQRLSEDLKFRGLLHQVTDPRVLERLDRGGVTFYAGFDPTAPSLHVGNLLQLCTMKRLQLYGNRPIIVAGGATALIGDPGGKSGERALQSSADVGDNLERVVPQLEKFLDFSAGAGPSKAVLLNNAQWLGEMCVVEFLRDVGKHFTVNQMVSKESVRARFERLDQGISYTEFSYMLLQAYDFLRLFQDHGCELQIGGSDQWGNITVGVDLIRKFSGDAFGLTTPLVTKSDGTKFGKTEDGSVWLDPSRTTPYRLYQFFLNSDDDVVGKYLRYFTFLPNEEIASLDAETDLHPERRSAARALAREVCSLVHGDDETARAQRISDVLFGGDISTLSEDELLDALSTAPSSDISKSSLTVGIPLVDLVASSGLVRSKADARRAIDQGGLRVNGEKVDRSDALVTQLDLMHDKYLILRKGKRSYHVVAAR
ncbi:MAG: tyrosine--tRNA ligase [Acidimicrobiales bacterium]